MSRRKKVHALARKVLPQRAVEDHTSHLTALRNVPAAVDVTAAADAVRRVPPILADVIRRTGFVPEPPWAAGTMLLPLVESAELESAGASA